VLQVRLSSAQARTAALSVATGDLLVFLDSTVVCAPGWLEPLVDAVVRHPDSIVSPHFDRIRDPVSSARLSSYDDLMRRYTHTHTHTHTHTPV